MADDYEVTSESVQVGLINHIFGVSTIMCNNFLIFIPEELINKIKTESQVLIIIKTFKHHKTGMNTEFYLITPTITPYV